MLQFKAVSHRLIFWILGASASLFLLISYYEYTTAERFLSQQIESRAKLAKSDLINRINSLLHNVRDSVNVAASLLPITTVNSANIEQQLKNIVREHSDIYGMAVALEPKWSRGQPRGFAPYYYHHQNDILYKDLSTAYDYRAKPWYRQAAESHQVSWSEPYFDEGGGNVNMVTYSAPIYHQTDKELIGVITADITLDMLNSLARQLELGPHSFAYIVSRQGNIITHTNATRVMENIANLQKSEQDYPRLTQLIANMLQGKTGTLTAPCSVMNTSEDCLLSYQPITGTNWSIVIGIPLHELNKSLLQYRNNSLVITAMGLLLLTIIVFSISRRLTRPLLALTHSSQALARGELDTVIPDINLSDEIGTLSRQFQRMQASLKTYIEQLKQETAQRERLEGELSAAHKIQMQMLPDYGHSSINHEKWQLSATLEPAKSVGGDFYFYQRLEDDGDRLFFTIGDVSDKGVAAALFMAKTLTLLRQFCLRTEDPGELLGLINQQLCQDNDSCMFVTVLCGVLDIRSGDLCLASAGHNAPLLLSDHCSVIDVTTGPALGFFPNTQFHSTQTCLAAASTLILTTDGIDEATNTAEQQYGEPRLQALINSAHVKDSQNLLELIIADVIDFRADAEASDDLTIMTITRH